MDHRWVVPGFVPEVLTPGSHLGHLVVDLWRDAVEGEVVRKPGGLGLEIKGSTPNLEKLVEAEPRPVCNEILAGRRVQECFRQWAGVFVVCDVWELHMLVELSREHIRPILLLEVDCR